MALKFFTDLIILLLIIYKQPCYGDDKEYILDTPKCKIPNLNPFSDEVMRLMVRQSYFQCNTTELLTYVKKTPDDGHVLYLRERLVPRNISEKLQCFYCNVVRSGTVRSPDVGYRITQCQNFRRYAVLDHDIVKVTCTIDNGNDSEIFYDNVHNIILKDPVRNKLRDYNSSRPFSVLFLVLDSVSRLNFIRTMPQTYNFLQDNNFIEMKGYTKIADNTFPNFMALLTGMSSRQAYENCNPRIIGSLDACPMIWYDYRDKGYITAYAEDDTLITTFNYHKKGFINPPTDYYFKPYFEVAESLAIPRFDYMGAKYCTGPENTGDRVLNLARDFSRTFLNQSTFGIFWANTFSHNYLNSPYRMDKQVRDFFFDLKQEGVLDDSFVILLSDHGFRSGKIRETSSGWLEERMPINMISVPKRFQNKFPEEYNNLKENENKLTNTYDMYMTLQYILTISGTSSRITQSPACPKCVSLFEKIPTDRSCEDAQILDEWCPCFGHFKTINATHEYVKNATRIALKKIAAAINVLANNCDKPILDKIKLSVISESLPQDLGTKYLFVAFETIPPSTVITTVKFKQFVKHKATFFIRGIDQDSFCIDKQKKKKNN